MLKYCLIHCRTLPQNSLSFWILLICSSASVYENKYVILAWLICIFIKFLHLWYSWTGPSHEHFTLWTLLPLSSGGKGEFDSSADLEDIKQSKTNLTRMDKHCRISLYKTGNGKGVPGGLKTAGEGNWGVIF